MRGIHKRDGTTILHYNTALALAKKLQVRGQERDILNALADIYTSLHKTNDVIRHLELALEITHELADRAGAAQITGKLGLAFLERGDSRKAHKIIFKAEHLYHSLNMQIPADVGQGRSELNLPGCLFFPRQLFRLVRRIYRG